MKRTVKVLAVAMALAAGGLPVVSAWAAETTPVAVQAAIDPARQLHEMTAFLRRNDLLGLAREAMSAEKFAELRTAYEYQRGRPISDEDRAEFEREIGRITAPDAVDRLMAEFRPKLDEARPQAQGGIMMAIGAAQMALASPDTELTAEQREMLRRALPGVQAWLTSTDFFDEATLRRALTLITGAARATGISNLDQLQMLSFEELLGHGGNLLAAAKSAVRLYGIDLDQIMATARYETVSIAGNAARVKATVTVFDAPLSTEFDMVLVDGRWQGKEAAIRVEAKVEAEAAAEG
jgi:hypothetical protein